MDAKQEYLDSVIAAFATIDAAVTICDANFIILYMNGKSALTFADEGGASLVGSSLIACHKPASVAAMRKILESGLPNVYTISKQGRKKLIWQGVWKSGNAVGGLVEVAMPIPDSMPHFDRG
jgi:hypothetical protein